MKPSSFAFSARVPTFHKLQGLNLFLIAILTFDLPTQSKRIEITDEVPQGILQAWQCSRILVFLMEIDKKHLELGATHSSLHPPRRPPPEAT